MKKLTTFLAAVLLSSSLFAGWWSNADVKSAGNYVETYTVITTTDSASVILTATPFAVRTEIFNDCPYVLYVGTNTSTLSTTGFPIIGSTTYTLDGQFTGTLYGTLEAAAAGDKSARTILYKKNQ